MRYVVPIARLFFSTIFILSSIGHFTRHTIEYGASQGVPMANFLVPFSGLLALCGGISILIGYKAKWGAWLIVIFLVPVTLTMHRFWGLSDPQVADLQRIMFLKNLSMLGGALFITYFGSGPFSLSKDSKF